MINTLDQFLAQKQFSKAVALGEQLALQNPQNTHVWLSLSEAYRSLGNCDESIRSSKHAFTLDPKLPFALAQYARCLLPTADYAAITVVLESGLRNTKFLQDKQQLWALETLAACAIGIDNWDAALQYYQTLLRLAPNKPHYHYMLGVVYSVKGERNKAIEALQQAIKLEPKLGAAYRALMDVDATLIDPEKITAMCTDQSLPITQQIEFHYVEGQLLQKQGQYPQSFKHYELANQLKRNTFKYSVDSDLALFNQIIGVRVKLKEKEVGGGSEANIFIVGLPRSGSTLVENLLVNSGKVEAAGELRDFEVLLLHALGKQATQQLSADDCEKLNHIDYASIGTQYRQRVSSRVKTNQHACDKNPFNFRFIGLILAALPDARIIHVKKQRMDAIFGNYKHQFASVAHYSYTLDELKTYYDGYDKLMQHWDALYPGRILHVQYEDLIQNPKTVSQTLYQSCDLPWQEDILNSSTQPREIKTASANQVRRGMNTRAIGAWKPYSDFLQDKDVSAKEP